jgi:predicted HTH domain antitoxin
MVPMKVEIELPRDLLSALDIPEAELGRRAQEWVVLELFQEGEISSGKASEILRLSKSQFIHLLHQRRLPYLDAEPNELKREAAAAEAASQPPHG